MTTKNSNGSGEGGDFKIGDAKQRVEGVEGRVEALEAFKVGLEGKELDKKIEEAIKDSTGIQDRIKGLIWSTFKDKIIWVIGTLIGLLALDFLKVLIEELAKKAAGG